MLPAGVPAETPASGAGIASPHQRAQPGRRARPACCRDHDRPLWWPRMSAIAGVRSGRFWINVAYTLLTLVIVAAGFFVAWYGFFCKNVFLSYPVSKQIEYGAIVDEFKPTIYEYKLRILR